MTSEEYVSKSHEHLRMFINRVNCLTKENLLDFTQIAVREAVIVTLARENRADMLTVTMDRHDGSFITFTYTPEKKSN